MDELKQEKIVKFFKEMLNVYEFDLIIDTNENFKSVFKLKDLQGGNLGGIEQENFYNGSCKSRHGLLRRVLGSHETLRRKRQRTLYSYR